MHSTLILLPLTALLSGISAIHLSSRNADPFPYTELYTRDTLNALDARSAEPVVFLAPLAVAGAKLAAGALARQGIKQGIKTAVKNTAKDTAKDAAMSGAQAGAEKAVQKQQQKKTRRALPLAFRRREVGRELVARGVLSSDWSSDF